MTAIAGIVHDGHVYLGGDSAGVERYGYSLAVRRDPKVFRNGELVMGFTTSFRMGDLLRYAFTPPRIHPDDDLDKWMRTTFVNEVRRCLKEGGWAGTKDGQETSGTFLVGVRGRLFEVEGDYQVGEASEGFNAVGCGAPIALGALYATEVADPCDRLIVALGAAERFSAGVRGPFTTVSTKGAAS